jgi:hypothetical protein
MSNITMLLFPANEGTVRIVPSWFTTNDRRTRATYLAGQCFLEIMPAFGNKRGKAIPILAGL